MQLYFQSIYITHNYSWMSCNPIYHCLLCFFLLEYSEVNIQDYLFPDIQYLKHHFDIVLFSLSFNSLSPL